VPETGKVERSLAYDAKTTAVVPCEPLHVQQIGLKSAEVMCVFSRMELRKPDWGAS